MSLKPLFADHIDKLTKTYQDAIDHCEDLSQNSILIHSGSEHFYFADDRAIPFQAYGHFLHWLPINKPDQFLLFCPGERPKYLQLIPSDYWYEQTIDNSAWWAECFDIVRIDKIHDITNYIETKDTVYLGEESKTVGSEMNCNPASLLNFLNFHRAYKSEYEITQLRLANKMALTGHAEAKNAFLGGQSEYQIHQAYLNACAILEDEAPYTNIVALDEKSAILHYQNKRRDKMENSQVLLIDAGYRVKGYGSDITRTYTRDSAHPVFKQLLSGMTDLEQELVSEVRPGKKYLDIHLLALSKIATLLRKLDVLRADLDTLMDNQLPQKFMPHGVGHLLGIQVHDVGGFQQDLQGNILAAPDHSPALRNTRVMEEEMVFTIEPGCYFIPLLLEPLRNSDKGKFVNWELVDALYPYGGIRIEDNIRVTKAVAENLTRNPLHTS